MPALQRAREQAKAVVCLSNLRQQGLTMSYYTDDHNGHYARTVTRGYSYGKVWVYELLEPYGPEQPDQDTAHPEGLWICPSDWAPTEFGSTNVHPTPWWQWMFCYVDWSDTLIDARPVFKYTSYAYHTINGDLDTLPYGLFDYNSGKSRKESEVRRPSQVLMFACGSMGRALTYFDPSNDRGMSYDPLHNESTGKAVNILACDGHSDTITNLRSELSNNQFDEEVDTWILPNRWYKVK